MSSLESEKVFGFCNLRTVQTLVSTSRVRYAPAKQERKKTLKKQISPTLCQWGPSELRPEGEEPGLVHTYSLSAEMVPFEK
jgi:hypothetical protein